MHKNPKRRGELGEITFLQRATALGLRVSKPFGDSDPYDFIVDNGRRRWLVQVKTSGKLCARNVYHVNAGRHAYAGRRAVPRLVPYLPEEVHFLAVLIVPEDTWYIVPVQALDGRVSLRIHSPDHPKRGDFAHYAEAWHLLQDQSDATTLVQNDDLDQNRNMSVPPRPRRRRLSRPRGAEGAENPNANRDTAPPV